MGGHVARLGTCAVHVGQTLDASGVRRGRHVDVALVCLARTIGVGGARHTEVFDRHSRHRLAELVGAAAVGVRQALRADIQVLVRRIDIAQGSRRALAVGVRQADGAGIFLRIGIDVTQRGRRLAVGVGLALDAVVFGVVHARVFVTRRLGGRAVGVGQTDQAHVLAGVGSVHFARRRRHRAV